MVEEKYLFRAPLLDAKQHVVGYQFGWQQPEGAPVNARQDNHQLLGLVAKLLTEVRSGLYFVNACLSSLQSDALKAMAPLRTVLVLRPEVLQEIGSAALLLALHQRGFGLALRGASQTFIRDNEVLLLRINYFLMDYEDPQFTETVKLLATRHPNSRAVAEQISGWAAFNVCAKQNDWCLFESFCLAPRSHQTTNTLSAGAVQILQLLQMVQENADIRQLEKVLQSDSTLSLKLLRYINSAGFGLSVDIGSLRHAVSMLGYTPLFRWLILMLARTSPDGFSPALLELSIIRGRFAELLARDFFSKSEAEHLFVVGMFSRLDHLLGMPMEKLLGEIKLPETVNQALISRTGIYGPFLALAEASEHQSGASASIAAPMCISSEQVNTAHLSALMWARQLDL